MYKLVAGKLYKAIYDSEDPINREEFKFRVLSVAGNTATIQNTKYKFQMVADCDVLLYGAIIEEIEEVKV